MTVGDLVEGMTMRDVNAGKTVSEVLRAQQTELTGMTAKVTAPFFTVVGNHDIARSRPRPPCFARANEESSEVWREFYGSDTYYSFVYKKVLFVCLNTMEGRAAGDGQGDPYRPVGGAQREQRFLGSLQPHGGGPRPVGDRRGGMVVWARPTSPLPSSASVPHPPTHS